MRNRSIPRWLSMAAIGLATALSPSVHAADAWPARPITIVCSYAPGGGADLMARLIAEKMSPILGVPIVVENRPGASAQIGTAFVANAAPDGYTALVDAASFAINPNLYPRLSYDGTKAFEAVGVLARFPSVIVVTPGFPAKSVAELIKLAQASPGNIQYASSGTGSAQNLSAVLFMQQTRTKMSEVPYKGGGPAMTDVMAGHVSMYFANVASATPNIKAGTLRALAVAGAHRVVALPQLPTLREAGVVDAEFYEWNGLFLPKGTPTAIVDKFARALEQVLDSPEVTKRIQELGGERLPGGRDGALGFIAEQSALAGRIIRSNNIKVD